MEFKKYQHLERYGTTEVRGIEKGILYIFPKLDGTNASIWLDEKGELQAGSRKRHLSLKEDNADFYKWTITQNNIIAYLQENPTHRLFGEWLVPHSLKTYKNDAWRNFYIFDVAIDKSEDEIKHQGDQKLRYLDYEIYQPLLVKNGLKFIPPIAKMENPSYDELITILKKNDYLIEENSGLGEGIVLKNYKFINRFGRTTFAKIIHSEFDEKSTRKTKKATLTNSIIEQKIAQDFVTEALIEKVYAKIDNAGGFTKKKTPQLLHTVYYDVIKEDSWTFIKKYKNPTIDFKKLQAYIFEEVRIKKPELFD